MSHRNRVSSRIVKYSTTLAAVGGALAWGWNPAGAAEGPSLGAARTFAILGASTVESSGNTAITGDVGVSPGTSITGFPPGVISDGSLHAGDAAAATAHSDAQLAYTFLAGMATIPANELTGQDLGGKTLQPGVYYFTSSAQLTGTLTLDAMGDSAAVFVFKIGSTLTTASAAFVNVINGGADYDESKVYWQVGSSATLGTNTVFTGNILAYANITITSGTSMKGNALAMNGAVTLDTNVVASPPIIEPGPAIIAPINLTAVLSGSPVVPAADLLWEDASDNETEFRVYRRVGAGPAWDLIATVPSTTTAGTGAVVSYQDPALARMMIYSYRVTAFEATVDESLPSNEALVDTGVFLPINLEAVLEGSPVIPSASLTWNDASDNETEFRVYRRDGAGPDWVLIATVPTEDSIGIGGDLAHLDEGLDRMMVYSYRVTAFGAAVGESLPSNEALVDTGDFFPIVLTAVLNESEGNQGTDLAWTDVSDDETEFRIYRKDSPDGEYTLIATVPSTDTAGTGGEMTYHDPILDPLSVYSYRVAAYGADGESALSNEALVLTTYGPAVRWLNVHLGRSRSTIRNRARVGGDRIFLRGSYVVIDVDSEVPSVLPTDEEDPRGNGIAVQIRAPGNMFLLNIPADDAGWKVSKKGVYRWKSAAGTTPKARFRLDTRKSEFQLNARKLDFPSVPVNDIIVSLTSYGATGSDTRVWEVRLKEPNGSGQRFTLPK